MRLENLSILIASPELQSRTKLREVLNHALYKCAVSYERSLNLVIERLKEGTSGQLDILFLSSAFPPETLSELIAAVQASTQKVKPAVIVCLSSSGKVTQIADLYMEGVDGFVSEPYTTDDLTALMHTVLERRKTEVPSSGKAKKVAEFLCAEATRLVDALALLQNNGDEVGGYALKDLRVLSQKLQSIHAQDPSAYEEALIETFGKAKAQVTTSRVRVTPVKKRPSHPGVVVTEMMSQRKLPKDRMVALLKMEEAAFDKFLLGSLDIDEELSRNLARAFGLTARDWLKMQKDYDAFQAKLKEPVRGSAPS